MVLSDSQSPVGWQDVEAGCVHVHSLLGLPYIPFRSLPLEGALRTTPPKFPPEPIDKEAETWRERPRVIPG